jgi:shikimate kinase
VLAARLGWGWTDLDTAIARAAAAPVPELIRGRGEAAFRELEAAALAEAVAAGGVLACGGGVLARPESRALLRAGAFVVWLHVTPREAARRLGEALARERPLLDGAGPLDARIGALEAARRALYEGAADAVVRTDGRTPAEVAEAVRAAWEAGWGTSGS